MRRIFHTETTLQLCAPGNILRIVYKLQDVGVGCEGSQFRGDLEYYSESDIAAKYRYSHPPALLGKAEQSKLQYSLGNKTKTFQNRG